MQLTIQPQYRWLQVIVFAFQKTRDNVECLDDNVFANVNIFTFSSHYKSLRQFLLVYWHFQVLSDLLTDSNKMMIDTTTHEAHHTLLALLYPIPVIHYNVELIIDTVYHDLVIIHYSIQTMSNGQYSTC